jgi:hypothetical protein
LKIKEAIIAEIRAPIGPQIDRISSPLINNFRLASGRPQPSAQTDFLARLPASVYQNALANFNQAKTRPETAPHRAIAPRPRSFPAGKSDELVCPHSAFGAQAGGTQQLGESDGLRVLQRDR